MSRRVSIATIVVLTMSLMAFWTFPAYGAGPGGAGPTDAAYLQGVQSGTLAPGEAGWFRLWDSGSGKALGVTLNYTPATVADDPGMVTFGVFVYQKQCLDFRLVQVGEGTPSGLPRGVKYWRGTSNVPQNFYIQVVNGAPYGVDYAIAFTGGTYPPPALAFSSAGPAVDVSNLIWRGQDAFIVPGPVTIYTDPYKLSKAQPKADLILATHDHVDHCSPEDVTKILQPDPADTTIVTVAACRTKLMEAGVDATFVLVKPGDKLQVKGIAIQAMPAYNIDKFRSPGVPYHPKESGYVGFLFTANGIRYWEMGDTDNLPEFAGMAPDVLLIPVGGRFVMTADEAVQAAKAINPKVAIPMHYGGSAGTAEDAATFKAKATVPVVVLKQE